MADPKKKTAWSAWDKILMLAIGLTLILAVSLTLWFKSLDTNPVVVMPTPIMPRPNAYDYFVAASNAVVDSDKIDFAIVKWNPANSTSKDNHAYTRAQKEALIKENTGAIQTLHAGFAYPFQAPPARSFTTSFPEYQKEREIARLLSLQAQTRAAKGDWNGALQSDLDAIQMGEMLPHGSVLIGDLVGIACQAIGRRQAWEAINHLSSPQAKAATHRLEQIDAHHVPFADTMQEEEWLGQAGMLELMQRYHWPIIYLFNVSHARIRVTGKQTVMSDYTQYMDQKVANARLPYAAHPSEPPVPNDTFCASLLSVFSNVDLNDARAETYNRLLLAMLALRAYQQDHGAYPPTLAALVPGYLKALPDDPLALSGPLRYKLTGTKYTLYSLGPDGKDDGGKPIFDASKGAPPAFAWSDRRYFVSQESKGDVVAGVNVN